MAEPTSNSKGTDAARRNRLEQRDQGYDPRERTPAQQRAVDAWERAQQKKYEDAAGQWKGFQMPPDEPLPPAPAKPKAKATHR